VLKVKDWIEYGTLLSSCFPLNIPLFTHERLRKDFSLFFFNLIAFALNEYNHHVLSSLRLGTAVLPHHTILTDFLFFYFFLDFFYKEWLDSVRILEGQPARHILIKTN